MLTFYSIVDKSIKHLDTGALLASLVPIATFFFLGCLCSQPETRSFSIVAHTSRTFGNAAANHSRLLCTKTQENVSQYQ